MIFATVCYEVTSYLALHTGGLSLNKKRRQAAVGAAREDNHPSLYYSDVGNIQPSLYYSDAGDINPKLCYSDVGNIHPKLCYSDAGDIHSSML